MIILDATTKKIRLRLAAAGTIPYTTSWSDITTTTFVPGAADGYSSGAAAVDIVAAPGASTERKVQHISVYNSSGASATVILEYWDNGTLIRLLSVALADGEHLFYTDAYGFAVMKTDGTLKLG